MGTQYTIYKDDTFGTLSIDEMSNELELNFNSGELYGVQCSDSMSPEEMTKIFL